MRRLAARLFPGSESEQDHFLDALLNPRHPRNPAVIWTSDDAPDLGDLPEIDRDQCPEWLPDTISFLRPEAEPGKSSLFEEGKIYPVDRSSVYTASAMLEAGQPRRILDVCAAPGGKSLFASVAFQPGYLLANEVVGKRLGILRHNLKKTGRPNFYTQNLDPAELSKEAPNAFDLVIVDAPCSGQSLLAKGTENPGCFHPNIVKGNARRQLRILTESARTVAPGGFLFYSTCTFSWHENEGIIQKFLKRNESFSTVAIPHLDPFSSALTEENTYRFYPHHIPGAGGFSCLMLREGEVGDLPELPDPLWEYPVGQN